MVELFSKTDHFAWVNLLKSEVHTQEQCCCTFCHSSMFCHYMVTKRAERSTRCTFCHSFASKTITCLFLSSLSVCVCLCVPVCMCVCAHECVRMCVCVCVCVCVCICSWQHARAHVCVVVYCVVFIIPASISPKLKFCIALSRLRGYCCQ